MVICRSGLIRGGQLYSFINFLLLFHYCMLFWYLFIFYRMVASLSINNIFWSIKKLKNESFKIYVVLPQCHLFKGQKSNNKVKKDHNQKKKHGYYISKWSQSSKPRKLFNLNHRRGSNQKALIISNFQYNNVEKGP